MSNLFKNLNSNKFFLNLSNAIKYLSIWRVMINSFKFY